MKSPDFNSCPALMSYLFFFFCKKKKKKTFLFMWLPWVLVAAHRVVVARGLSFSATRGI